MENLKLLQEVEKLPTLLAEGEMPSERDIATWTKRIFTALLTFDRGPQRPESEKVQELEKLLDIYVSYMSTGKHDFNIDLFFMDQFHYSSYDCLGKQLFIGTSTQLLGFGSIGILSVDKLCIMHGSDVPMLLRQSGAVFTLVGQCYFEKWLHGDLVDWEIDGPDELVII